MQNILILFAHPRYENSRANRALLQGLRGLEGVTVHDLYEQYPDFNIDLAREQIRLQEQLLAVDRASNPTLNDHAWDTSAPVPAAAQSPA